MTEPSQSSAAGGSGSTPASDFLLWREVDRLDRRIDETRGRLDVLDQHGTRGVDALRNQVLQLAKDIEQHEQLHQAQTEQQITGRRWVIGTVCALIVPLYPLLGYALTQLPR